MYFNQDPNSPPPSVIIHQQEQPKESKPKKMSQPVLLSLALAYTQKCIDLGIDAEEFTSKFIHIYSNLKSYNDGPKKKKRRKYAITQGVK